MYVVDAIGKPGPYEYPYLPPYVGPAFPPALPDPDGHFDHLEIGSPAFRAAHMYATVRRVLDIWEGYAGHRIDWHFRGVHNRLELVPYVAGRTPRPGSASSRPDMLVTSAVSHASTGRTSTCSPTSWDTC